MFVNAFRHLESRDEADPNLFLLPSDISQDGLPADGGSDIFGSTGVDGGGGGMEGDGMNTAQSGADGGLDSSSLVAFNADDLNTVALDGEIDSTPLPPLLDDSVIANDQVVSSCGGPARRKRDISDEDLLLLGEEVSSCNK